MMTTIRLNDTITYRPCFGTAAPKKAVVVGMSLTKYPREKEGEPVNLVGIPAVKANKVIFDLDDGHWCYSDQVVI